MRTAVYLLLLILVALGYRVSTSPEWQDAIGDAATWAIKPVIVPIVQLINIPAFVYVVSILIILAAIIACALYWLQSVRPQIAELRALRRGIADLPQPGPAAPQTWPEVLGRLGALLRGKSGFGAAWSEFHQQAVRSRGVPPAHFAELVAAQAPGRDRSGLMQSLPGYFTSLGLIFTFVGLVVALYFAAKGFRSGNIEEARASIIQLLNAASFKFLTSVAALIAAMLVSVFLRANLATIARESALTAQWVDEFLSIWRERLGTGPIDETPIAAILVQRIDALVESVQGLVGAIEAMTERDGAAILEKRRAAR